MQLGWMILKQLPKPLCWVWIMLINREEDDCQMVGRMGCKCPQRFCFSSHLFFFGFELILSLYVTSWLSGVVLDSQHLKFRSFRLILDCELYQVHFWGASIWFDYNKLVMRSREFYRGHCLCVNGSLHVNWLGLYVSRYLLLSCVWMK